MTTSKLINYTTREFVSENELELYAAKQDQIFTSEVIEEFKKAGMLRRVLTKLWNKEGVHRVGILFEYRDEKAFAACQSLLEKHYIPMVKKFITKVVAVVVLWYTNLLLKNLNNKFTVRDINNDNCNCYL